MPHVTLRLRYNMPVYGPPTSYLPPACNRLQRRPELKAGGRDTVLPDFGFQPASRPGLSAWLR
jgi:hypothetical protein